MAKDSPFQHGDYYLWLTVGCGNHFPEAAVQCLEGIIVAAGGLLSRSGHVLDVAAGTEVPASTAQNDGANGCIAGHAFKHRHQFVHHGQAHGIAAFGPVQRDMQDGAVKVKGDCFGLR
jgi:hypothetical protein